MKKRSTLTIVTIAIVFALLIVGVYCAISLDVGMGGSLTYEADGTFTEISAQIKQGSDLDSIENVAGSDYTMEKSLTQTNVVTWSAPSVKLSLSKPVATYEFTIKNVGSEDITFYPAEDISVPANVTCYEEIAELLRIKPETEATGRLVFEYTGSNAAITEVNPKVNFKLVKTASLKPTDSTLFTATSATTLKLAKTPTASMLPDSRILVVPDTVSGYTITGTDNGTSSSTAPFRSLSNSVKYVVLPSTLTALNGYAFYSGSTTSGSCGGRYLKAVNIPDNCSTFGQYLFYYNTNLNQVYLGQSIKYLTSNIFNNCSNMRTIKVPATLTSTSYLTSYSTFGTSRYFEVDENNTTLSSYEGGLYNKAKTILYAAPSSRKVKLIDGLTTICSPAFYKLKEIKEITIPSTVTTINSYAFYGCSFDKITYSRSGTGYTYTNGTLNITSTPGNLSYLTGLIKKLVVTSGVDISSASLDVTGAESVSYSYAPSGENWTYKNGVMTYFEKGDLSYGWSSSGAPLYASSYRWILPLILKVELPATFTYVGSFMFYKMTALKDLTFPESLTGRLSDSESYSDLYSLENCYVDSSTVLDYFNGLSTPGHLLTGETSDPAGNPVDPTWYFNARLFTRSQLPSWMTVVETVTPSGKTDSYYKVSF